MVLPINQAAWIRWRGAVERTMQTKYGVNTSDWSTQADWYEDMFNKGVAPSEAARLAYFTGHRLGGCD